MWRKNSKETHTGFLLLTLKCTDITQGIPIRIRERTRLELIKADWKGSDIQGRLTATRHISFSSIICSLISFLFQATWVKAPHFKGNYCARNKCVAANLDTFAIPSYSFVNNAINPKAPIAFSNSFDYLVNIGWHIFHIMYRQFRQTTVTHKQLGLNSLLKWGRYWLELWPNVSRSMTWCSFFCLDLQKHINMEINLKHLYDEHVDFFSYNFEGVK